MCGLIGIYSPRKPVAQQAVFNALKTLVHRGPDWQQSSMLAGGKVALGHARLSIIDLSTGQQPMANEDETLWVVANGEFYDFERIRAELKEKGHTFRTESDSEIVLHLYEEHGAQCLQRLRGEFALVLWDERNQLLFAARDRFGIKPLFYAFHDGALYLASEAKALFAAGVPARWDEDAVFESFGGMHAADRTLFEGVSQVPPGHYLYATASHHRLMRYWDFNYPPEEETRDYGSEPELIEGFRERLEDAVRTRLRADVPVGCYLSGGIDSCSVLALASKLSNRPVKAFTLQFDHAEYDESAIAREMAAFCGAEFHPLPVTHRDMADHFDRAVWHTETMFFNSHGIAKYLLSRFVRDAGYKVVLTGEGSDEILGGYPHFRQDMLLHASRGEDPERLRQRIRAINEKDVMGRLMNRMFDALPEPPATLVRQLGYAPMFISSAGNRFQMVGNAVLKDDFVERYAGRDGLQLFLMGLDVPGQLKGRHPMNQSMYLWSKSMLPNYILSLLGDRMEMAHSIEGRLPFLDHLLVEYTVRLPVSLKVRGETEKYVLREAMKPLLTDTVYRRTKHPFSAPPATASEERPMLAYLQDLLRSQVVDSVPFLDRNKIRGMLDAIPGMAPGMLAMVDPLLTMLGSACLLHRELKLG